MRQEYWHGNKHNGHLRVRIICDKCKTELGNEPMGWNEKLSIKYQGMNTGQHECDRCRKTRERAYDVYVTSPGR